MLGRQPGIADGDWNGVVWVIVFVTVGGAGCRSLRCCALRTIRVAMAIANAPSTPPAHSSARCIDETRRGGGVGGPIGGLELTVGGLERTVVELGNPAGVATGLSSSGRKA